jgi:DNA-directed RNA polymerase specialized sigma24 family protein
MKTICASSSRIASPGRTEGSSWHRRADDAPAKRSGLWAHVTLDHTLARQNPREVDVLDPDRALSEPATFDARKCQVAELRFFAGLSLEETGHACGRSVATVEREWQAARAWLYLQLTGSRASARTSAR